MKENILKFHSDTLQEDVEISDDELNNFLGSLFELNAFSVNDSDARYGELWVDYILDNFDYKLDDNGNLEYLYITDKEGNKECYNDWPEEIYSPFDEFDIEKVLTLFNDDGYCITVSGEFSGTPTRFYGHFEDTGDEYIDAEITDEKITEIKFNDGNDNSYDLTELLNSNVRDYISSVALNEMEEKMIEDLDNNQDDYE